MIEELLSHVDFKKIHVSDFEHIEQSLLAKDGQASSILRNLLSKAFQQLAITSESHPMNKMDTSTNSLMARCYVSERPFRRVRLSNRYAFITPRCDDDMEMKHPDVADHYTWTLSYERKANNTSFMITVPKITREVNSTDAPYSVKRHYLYNDIAGTVRVDVMVLLKNSHGVICHVGKISINTELPQVDGGLVVKFPLEEGDKGDQNIPNECLVSFEIGKA